MVIIGGVIAVGLSLGITGPDGAAQFASLVPRAEPRLSLASRPHRPDPIRVRATTPIVAAPITAAAPVVDEGFARFIMKTPGARITARLRDVPGDEERAVHSDSIRLPVGRWIVRATAPGYQTCVWYVQVKPSHSTVVVVSLKPAGSTIDALPPQTS